MSCVNRDLLLMSVAPAAVVRAARVAAAVRMINNGVSLTTARALVIERYGVSRITAWRIVHIAAELLER